MLFWQRSSVLLQQGRKPESGVKCYISLTHKRENLHLLPANLVHLKYNTVSTLSTDIWLYFSLLLVRNDLVRHVWFCGMSLTKSLQQFCSFGWCARSLMVEILSAIDTSRKSNGSRSIHAKINFNHRLHGAVETSAPRAALYCRLTHVHAPTVVPRGVTYCFSGPSDGIYSF